MNIWLINPYYVPPNFPGSSRHHLLAKQLVRKGHTVTIVAANYNHYSYEYLYPTKKKEIVKKIIEGVTVIFFPVISYRSNGVKRLLNMLQFCYALLTQKNQLPTEKPDCIIGSSPHLFAARMAMHLAKQYQVPFVLEVRDLWPESLVQLGRIARYHPLILWMNDLEKQCYKGATKIINVLRHADQYIAKKGDFQHKCVYLPNFVDLKELENSSKADVPSKQSDIFHFIYAGSFNRANNLDLFLSGLKQLQEQSPKKPYQVTLIGEGPTKNHCTTRVKEENIKNITFLKAVPKTAIYSYLQKADVGIMLFADSLLYQWGISPNKLFDYMGMGKPIILAVKTSDDIVSAAQAGITVNNNSPKSLAEAMLYFMELPKEKLRKLGENGRRYVEEHHTVNIIADRLETALNVAKNKNVP